MMRNWRSLVTPNPSSEGLARNGSGPQATMGRFQIPSTAEFLISSAIIIAGLLFFKQVLVPIAVAVLLSFILAPIVRFLRRWKVPRIFAVLVVVALAFTTIFALGAIVSSQLGQLAEDLPKYELTMREKINSLRKATIERVAFKRASEALSELKTGIEKDQEAARAQPTIPAGADSKPLPVLIQQPSPTAFESMQAVVSPLISLFETSLISIVLVIFFLVQQEDLRNRFVRIAGVYDLQRTTLAIDDAGRRLSQYLFSQATINSTFAFVVAGALWLIGIPNAVLWGILAGLLRFIPYVGAVAAAVLPLALAAAIDPGWSLFVMTLCVFVLLEPVIAYGIEPLIYGRSVGLSPVAIVTSAVVWTSLWGPVGLLLSIPLTMCLVVLGRHVESLGFLDVLLSDQEPLTPAQIFYQRMLSGNSDEAAHETEADLKTTELLDYFDSVVLEAIRLAQVDTWRGVVETGSIVEFIKSYVANLEEAKDAHETSYDADDARSVLCVSTNGPIDDAVCLLLAYALRDRGISTKAMSRQELVSQSDTTTSGSQFTLVCVSCMDFSSRGKLKYAVQRARRKQPDAFIVAGIWTAPDVSKKSEVREEIRSDDIANTFRQILELCNSNVRHDRHLKASARKGRRNQSQN